MARDQAFGLKILQIPNFATITSAWRSAKYAEVYSRDWQPIEHLTGWIPVKRHENDPPEQKAAYLATVPAGDAGSFISGQNMCVNGGLTVA